MRCPAVSALAEVFPTHDKADPEPHDVERCARDAWEVEELRHAVRAVVMVYRDLSDPKARVLDLLHHLEADDAAAFLESDAIEDGPPQQAEVAVDVAQPQAEQELHHVVV